MVLLAAGLGAGGVYYFRQPKPKTVTINVPENIETIIERAVHIVTYLNQDMAGASGQAKRDAAYGRLLKEFAHNSHRDCGLAVELAVRRIKAS